MNMRLLFAISCGLITLSVLSEPLSGAKFDLAAFETTIDRHLSAGEYAQAEALAGSVISQDVGSLVILRAKQALAKTYICSQRFNAAETLTSDIVAQSAADPNLVQTLCQIGKTWEGTGQADRAAVVYKRAANDFTANPFAIWAQKNLCTLYLDIKNTASAQGATDHLLSVFAENPNISQAICNVGDAWLRSGDANKAIGLFEHVVAHYPEAVFSIWAQKNLCTIYAAQKNTVAGDAAIAKLKTVFNENSNISKAICQVGDAWLKNGDTARAIQLYEYAVASYPAASHSIWSQKNLCTIYAAQKNTTAGDAAIAKLKTAFKQHSSAFWALCEVGDAWLKNGDAMRAIQLYEYAAATYPAASPSISVQKNLCTIYAAQKNTVAGDAAIAKLKTVFKQDSGISQALCQVGDAWLKTGDTARAIQLYEYAVANYPAASHSIWSQKNLCTLYAREVDVDAGEAALTVLKTVFNNHPNVDQALCEVGNAWQKAGFSVKAESIFNYVAEHYPNSDYALWSQKNIVALRIENRDFEEAKAAWTQLRGAFGNHSKFRQASLQVANLWKDADAYDQASDIYSEIVSWHPGTTEALWAIKNLGVIAVRKDQDAAAQICVDKLMTEYRGNRFVAEAVLLIGEEYYFVGNDSHDTGVHAKAVEVIEKAITLLNAGDPAAAVYLYAKALSLRALEQYGNAAEAFKRACQANAHFIHADYCYFAIADCYERLAQDGMISKTEADSVITSQFNQLVERHPTSKYTTIARNYLSRH